MLFLFSTECKILQGQKLNSNERNCLYKPEYIVIIQELFRVFDKYYAQKVFVLQRTKLSGKIILGELTPNKQENDKERRLKANQFLKFCKI